MSVNFSTSAGWRENVQLTLSNSTFYYTINSFLIKIKTPARKESLLNNALLFDKLPYSMKISFPLKIELESVNCISFLSQKVNNALLIVYIKPFGAPVKNNELYGIVQYFSSIKQSY